MNKDYYVEWGFSLPFRFYLGNRNKANRDSDYGRRINIPPTEFILMPHNVILPFQVIRDTTLSIEYNFKLVCLDNGVEIDLMAEYDLTSLFGIISKGGYDYIYFLGEDNGIDIPSGGYYAVFSDGISEYFSEDIKVLSQAEFEATATFRKWSLNDDDIRTTGEDLRII